MGEEICCLPSNLVVKIVSLNSSLIFVERLWSLWKIHWRHWLLLFSSNWLSILTSELVVRIYEELPWLLCLHIILLFSLCRRGGLNFEFVFHVMRLISVWCLGLGLINTIDCKMGELRTFDFNWGLTWHLGVIATATVHIKVITLLWKHDLGWLKLMLADHAKWHCIFSWHKS